MEVLLRFRRGWKEAAEIGNAGRTRNVGGHMQAELRRRFAGHKLVGEVRGIGGSKDLSFAGSGGNAPDLA